MYKSICSKYKYNTFTCSTCTCPTSISYVEIVFNSLIDHSNLVDNRTKF